MTLGITSLWLLFELNTAALVGSHPRPDENSMTGRPPRADIVLKQV